MSRKVKESGIVHTVREGDRTQEQLITMSPVAEGSTLIIRNTLYRVIRCREDRSQQDGWISGYTSIVERIPNGEES